VGRLFFSSDAVDAELRTCPPTAIAVLPLRESPWYAATFCFSSDTCS
jgi:hypothetical protein